MKTLFLRCFAIATATASLFACGSRAAESEGTSGTQALGTPGVANDADHGCNVVLRDLAAPENRGGVDTNCVGSGELTCWVVFQGDLDISATAVREGDTPYVYYQSGSDPNWYTAPATPTPGAGTGMVRYAFSLNQNTAILGQPYPTIQVIPYLQTVTGTHLFDHNDYAGNYTLNTNNNWTIQPNGGVCYAPTPPAIATLMFSTGWTDTVGGALVPGGKLDVSYDLNRMPQCFAASTDGVSAWNTQAYAYFLPGKQLLQGSVKGPNVNGAWQSRLFETDIPTDATSVALWFETSGDGCSTSWDSVYGQNYNFGVAPQ